MTNISDSLENLQKTVGGNIEIVPLVGSLYVVCNENGKNLGLEPNMKIPGDLLVGTIIICGTKGENLADIPVDFQTWKTTKDVIERNSIF